MKSQTREIIKNNYAVDFVGTGSKTFDYSPEDLKNCIENDIRIGFDCVTHLSVMVKMQEALNLEEQTQLSIHLYMKVLDCEEKQDLMGVINSYLNTTFLN